MIEEAPLTDGASCLTFGGKSHSPCVHKPQLFSLACLHSSPACRWERGASAAAAAQPASQTLQRSEPGSIHAQSSDMAGLHVLWGPWPSQCLLQVIQDKTTECCECEVAYSWNLFIPLNQWNNFFIIISIFFNSSCCLSRIVRKKYFNANWT